MKRADLHPSLSLAGSSNPSATPPEFEGASVAASRSRPQDVRPTLASTGGKIGARHLQRRAIVYVRQSTPHQVAEHRESLAREYALRERALQLGWNANDIVVIDEDLGLSGRSSDNRHGFQRLLAETAADRVGMVLAVEMSRLARNSRDWHQLFELCAFRDTLLADEDGVYQTLDVNDRLILGMKGILSEMELHVMKGRLERGRQLKASRGELYHSVPWGFVLRADGTVEQDPDERVRSVVNLMFDRFTELGSAYALLRALLAADILVPRRDRDGVLLWRKPSESIVTSFLHHPIYAGAYAWGRRHTKTDVTADGHVRARRKFGTPDEWKVLLHDRVPSYISWETYLMNQRRLKQNQSRPRTSGTPRGGAALGVGVVYCGRCGRKMQIQYVNANAPRYECSRRALVDGDVACGGLAARTLDALLERQLMMALQPASLELSLQAVERARVERSRLEQQLQQRVSQAAYESELAERQYQLVDPANRLVASTLEHRWEAAMEKHREAQEKCDRFRRENVRDLSVDERARLQRLSEDIPALWSDPATSQKDRQDLLRCLIERVEFTHAAAPHVDVKIRWAGGYESRHGLRRTLSRYTQLPDLAELVARAVELRRAGLRARVIAEHLNAEGYLPPKQCGTFTGHVVQMLFSRKGPAYGLVDAPSGDPNVWGTPTLSKRLRVDEKKLKDWVRRGWLRAIQRPFGGTWTVWADAEELTRIERLAASSRSGNHPAAELTTPKLMPK